LSPSRGLSSHVRRFVDATLDATSGEQQEEQHGHTQQGDRAKGKARDTMGRATGNKSQQAKGKMDQAKGKVGQMVDKAKARMR
jgi:uncharacterized protein YjbJ (UPF0337 family)